MIPAPVPLPPLHLTLGGASGPAVSGSTPTVNSNWSPAPWDPFGGGSSSVLGVPTGLLLAAGLAALYIWKK